MFKPTAQASRVAITPRHTCLVIDDALSEPQHWVDWAAEHRAEFRDAPHNAFPGPELALPESVVERIAAFFAVHARGALGGRRTLRSLARLSLTTRRPDELQPAQWMCHVDNAGLAPGHCLLAGVLYLFKRPELGGTAFYAPNRPVAEIAAMKQDAMTLPPDEFTARHGIAPGYMTASNAWFRRLLGIGARWNRLIFYPGTVLHSADIARPDLLDPDPRSGRLTINTFFTCTRKADA